MRDSKFPEWKKFKFKEKFAFLAFVIWFYCLSVKWETFSCGVLRLDRFHVVTYIIIESFSMTKFHHMFHFLFLYDKISSKLWIPKFITQNFFLQENILLIADKRSCATPLINLSIIQMKNTQNSQHFHNATLFFFIYMFADD